MVIDAQCKWPHKVIVNRPLVVLAGTIFQCKSHFLHHAAVVARQKLKAEIPGTERLAGHSSRHSETRKRSGADVHPVNVGLVAAERDIGNPQHILRRRLRPEHEHRIAANVSQLGVDFLPSRVEQLHDGIQPRTDSPGDDLTRDNLAGLGREPEIVHVPLTEDLPIQSDREFDFLGGGEGRVRFGLDELRQIADHKRPRAGAALSTAHMPVRRPKRSVFIDRQLRCPFARVRNRRDRGHSLRRFFSLQLQLFRQLAAFGDALAPHHKVSAGEEYTPHRLGL